MLRISQELVNHASVQRILNEKPERLYGLVVSSANHAARKISNRVGKITVENWNIPEVPKDVSIKVERAKAGDEHPVAALVIRGGMNTVYKMSSKTRHISGGGVSAMVFGKQYPFKRAFVAQMASGHVGIFENRGRISKKTGQPAIDELYTLSFPQMVEDIKKNRIPDELAKIAQAAFEKEFVRVCDSWLQKEGAK
jgi:hypothetical protein